MSNTPDHFPPLTGGEAGGLQDSATGAPGGVAPLDDDARVPLVNLPVHLAPEDLGNEVLTLLATYSPGAVQDFAQRTTLFTTTNLAINDTAAGSQITGLEVDVVGTGRRVELSFFVAAARGAVADGYVGVYLLTSVDGSAFSAATFPRTVSGSGPVAGGNGNRSIAGLWDLDTVEGTNYTFRVGVYGQSGTTTMDAFGIYPITLKARNH